MPPIRKPGPVKFDARDRARGALLGLAVGDALGTTLEFKPLSAPPFPELCDGPHREVTGGGPFKVRPGQVTDDTQMAVALSQSLRALKTFRGEDVLARYRGWLPHAFDVGNQTRAALEGANPTLGPFEGAKQHWLHSGRKPAGNGSLMRTAPIGVFFAKDRDTRLRASFEDSALTHFDPRCQLACGVFNGAIAFAVGQPAGNDPAKVLAAAQGELSGAAATLGRMIPEYVREVQEAAQLVRDDLAWAQKEDPQLYGPELHLQHQAGFVRVAFRLAFWELLHAPSYEAALIDVVNRGADADTNGAITGALLGAVHGEQQIPQTWRETVLHASPVQPLFRDALHPRELLPLAS